jgi:transketolase
LDRNVYAPTEGLRKGAYVLGDLGEGDPEMILMASGSEVGLIEEAGRKLVEKGHSVRLVSFPCWELFQEQDKAYRKSVLLPEIELRLAVEAGVTLGWHRWVGSKGLVVGLDRFGASAPGDVVFEKLGFSTDNIVEKALSLLQ